MSFNADATNRGPTFDMDLAELVKNGEPISYAEARKYFQRDPAVRCVRGVWRTMNFEGAHRCRHGGIMGHLQNGHQNK